MRVAVVIYGEKHEQKLLEIAQSLARGIASQGHEVDIMNGKHELNKKLTFYEYIALGTEHTGFFGGKIPVGVKNFLRQSGTVSGKRCFAFVIKGSLRPMKTLRELMKLMEEEGMFLKTSDIITKAASAEEIGKRLHIKRS